LNELIVHILDGVSLGIGIAGVAVVTWGAIKALVELVRLEILGLRRGFICSKREYLRHHLGSYLLLGLELLVAADVVHTIVKPDLQSLAILGGIVAIRTVISFFLNRELSNSHNCREESGKIKAG
jgi:uncharacterized membrane protein